MAGRPLPSKRVLRLLILCAVCIAGFVLVLQYFNSTLPVPVTKRPGFQRMMNARANAAMRADAVGPLDGLSAVERSAYAIVGFDPIDEPRGMDWLMVHDEPGQSFTRYVRSTPNRPSAARLKIYLLPLGAFSAEQMELLNQAGEFTTRYFQMPAQLLPVLPLDELTLTTRPAKDGGGIQILTSDVLRLLKPRLPSDAYCMLAVTFHDLYPAEDWNFVFGQASLRERVGVFSFSRFDRGATDSDERHGTELLLLLRCCKTLAHEVGHMFGIHHCIYFDCVMNGSNHLGESDLKPIHLCPLDLRKLRWAHDFDLLDRYGQLAEVYQDVQLEEEAAWVTNRLARLSNAAVSH